ncbi:M23 family metallopeptidase [Thiomicrorhabdus xiamenensis]|uniref:M23 family metallopeptidase n=1 Tax=Thiomicrorhabdus xiamenensis TaxID=2739063 RepID=A0A7D4NQU2_9GAMM|nr:M23 family metallopeptidase [Thiomicrorhabdus xiamenensis]QKI89192.1 M23 family metallopeptidase [Thiomicrorhabdus xiamenensis]
METYLKKNLPLIAVVSISLLQLQGCSSPLKYDPSARDDGRPAPVLKSQPVSGANSCSSVYIVKPGDSLSRIAEKCQVPLTLLQEVNHISRADLIYVNQELKIPYSDNASAYDSSINTDNSVNTYHVSREPAYSEDLSADSVKQWSWPMSKQTDYRFIRDEHGISALEIYGFIGQKVYAMADGEVVFAGDGITEYGNMIMLKHPDGKLSVYAHNQRLLVKKGDQVRSGAQIATMGSTGLTDKPKLYTEVRYHGQKISIKKVLGE